MAMKRRDFLKAVGCVCVGVGLPEATNDDAMRQWLLDEYMSHLRQQEIIEFLSKPRFPPAMYRDMNEYMDHLDARPGLAERLEVCCATP
jgi:hypothetical protein